MSHKKKRNIIIVSLCGVLLLMVVGYAAFSSVLNIKGTSNISSNWDIKITSITSKTLSGNATNAKDPEGIGTLEASFETNLESPGDSIEYTITISNGGNINAKLDKITLSDPDNEYITFETSGLTEGDKLNTGSTAELKVTVTFKDVEINKMEKSTSNLTVTLDYSQADSSSDMPGPSGPYAAEMLAEKVVTTGDGLYLDTYESDETQKKYIYRGKNPNNYITFNDELWRIISLEKDGTLKIIRKSSIGSKMYDPTKVRTAEYCNYSNVYGCNVWGSSSTMLDAQGNHISSMPRTNTETTTYALPTEEAQINTYLNNDYYNTLNETAQSQIDKEHLWNVGLVDENNETLNESLQEEQNYKWQGKVGLFNVTDFIKASLDANCTNVYKGSDSDASKPCGNNNYLQRAGFWTITPSSYKGSGFVWYQPYYAYVTPQYTSVTKNVFPAVYLKSDTQLTGEGTETEPYTIIAG